MPPGARRAVGIAIAIGSTLWGCCVHGACEYPRPSTAGSAPSVPHGGPCRALPCPAGARNGGREAGPKSRPDAAHAAAGDRQQRVQQTLQPLHPGEVPGSTKAPQGPLLQVPLALTPPPPCPTNTSVQTVPFGGVPAAVRARCVRSALATWGTGTRRYPAGAACDLATALPMVPPCPCLAVRTIGGHWLKQWTVGGEGRGEQARLEPNADIAT